MKVHIGQDTELQYKLQGFGIPVDLIPVTGTGNIKTQYLRQFINTRKMIETEALTKSNNNDGISNNSNNNNNKGTTQRSSSSNGIVVAAASAPAVVVECPGSNDVVFKPGKRLMCHPGNVLFQNLILSKTNQYTTSMVSKQDIYKWLSEEIVQKRGGRFLKWNDNRRSCSSEKKNNKKNGGGAGMSS